LGNQAYQKENYTKALSVYQQVLSKGLTSSELYFNMANVHYKTNQIAKAIYYYEKALQLNPNNTDAKENLILANKKTIDSIKKVPRTFVSKFLNSVLTIYHYNTWAKITVITLLITTGIWLMFLFYTQTSLKKLFFTLGIVTSFLSLLSLGICHQQYKNTTTNVSAIIFTDRVEIKNAPRTSATNVFTLHLGTKILILDSVGQWKKVKIADGQIGWLPEKSIKQI